LLVGHHRNVGLAAPVDHTCWIIPSSQSKAVRTFPNRKSHRDYSIRYESAPSSLVMSSLKRKRSRSNDDSPDGINASGQSLPTPTVAVDQRGEKRARNTIAVESQQVCGFIQISRVVLQLDIRTVALEGPQCMQILT
jgi:hypothetical protein